MNPIKNSTSARRTYTLLRVALFEQLASAPFERITLTDLCSASLVPRSTFYRYFEDKYDLLQFCLLTLVEELGLTDDVIFMRSSESLRSFLHILIDHINENLRIYQKIYAANKDGELMSIIQSGLKRILSEKLREAERNGRSPKIAYPIFSTLLSDFYFSIIQCYLELEGEFEIHDFIDQVCRFADREFFFDSPAK